MFKLHNINGGVKLDIADKIKQIRKNNNLSQTEFAAKLDIKKSAVSFYESGERTPSLKVIKNVAKTFKVSSDYLLGLTPPQCVDVSGLDDDDLFIIETMINTLREKKQKK